MYENQKNTISCALLNWESSKFTITRRQKSGQIIEIITLIRPFSAELLRKKSWIYQVDIHSQKNLTIPCKKKEQKRKPQKEKTDQQNIPQIISD